MGFSIIIPSKNATNLIPCVQSILTQDTNIKPEQIIVVDDGAKWGSEHILSDKIRWIEGQKPFIFSRNINLGIDAAGTDDVLLCNDDIILKTQNGFTNLARAGQNYGVTSAVTNSVGNLNQTPKYGGSSIRFDNRVLAFVCVYIPRSIIEAVGKLDERFGVCYGGEDNSYCRKVLLAGYKLCIYNDCFVDHLTLTSTFRGKGKSLPIGDANRVFKEIWGVDMTDIPKVP
jgi:GT2 family glycosyltransferase